jgi:CIC family chloride channel protein
MSELSGADGAVSIAPARESRGRHFPRAALVGMLAGALGVAYARALYYAELGREGLLARLHDHPLWGWAVLPLIGLAVGCLIGWMTRRLAPEAAGSGIPHIKAVLAGVRPMRWARVIPVKFIAGVLGAGIGLSLGREGPTVQLGAAVGRGVGGMARLKRRAIPQLVACGAGAGLAAAFNAPLAGFIFVIEELQREMSPLTYGGALIAAVAADVVTRWFIGQVPSFNLMQMGARAPQALPLAAIPLMIVLGAVVGVVGVAFNKALVGGLKLTHRHGNVPGWAWPGAAGVIAGSIAWWLPDAVGGGHAVAERFLLGTAQRGLAAIAVLFVVKFLLTAVSYASGAPGGIFAPMLVLGALMGSALGRVVGMASPDLGRPETFALLGMGAFFASSVRAPLTGIILILEMTANYEQLFALSIVCLTAYLVAERLKDRPIYDALLEYDLARSGEGPAEDEPTQVVVSVMHGSELEGKLLKSAGFPARSLVVLVTRGGKELVPRGDLELRPGDHLTVLVEGSDMAGALRVSEMARPR